MNKILRFCRDSEYRFNILEDRGFFDKYSDEHYIKLRYKSIFKKNLNLDNPQTFNEKLQWLKLNNRNPIYTTMADKFTVREYLKEKEAEEIIVPLVGGPWKSFDEIQFDKLPDKFVIKTTHDSGGLYICKDKTQADKEQIKQRVERSLKRKYYLHGREWPYKDIHPQIIAEKYIKDDICDVLRVYKIMNFNGIPRLIQMINNDKTKNETINYYDTDWNLLDLRQNFPNGPIDPKPAKLSEMLEWASRLSKDIPFVRTDFYQANNRVYFSEFTFFTDSGFVPFIPDEWDLILGKYLDIKK